MKQTDSADYRAPCPLPDHSPTHPSTRGGHSEHDPFYIRPSAGRWWCFGCERSGDAIDLVMSVERVSFLEAVEVLKTPRLASRLTGASALWRAASPLDAPEAHATAKLLKARDVAVDQATAFGLAKLLPSPDRYPYPAWLSSSHYETHPLVIRAYEADGSLGALCLCSPATLKTCWPTTPKARFEGLTMADACGAAYLRGRIPNDEVEAVFVADDPLSWLRLSTWTRTNRYRVLVFGTGPGIPSSFPTRFPAWRYQMTEI